MYFQGASILINLLEQNYFNILKLNIIYKIKSIYYYIISDNNLLYVYVIITFRVRTTKKYG